MTETPKMYTEKEVVLRERKAFEYGAELFCARTFEAGQFHQAAVVRFPLPKVTRPRTTTDGGGRVYRSVDGIVQVNHGNGWVTASTVPSFLVRVLADLLDDPTEDVPDDE